MPQTRAAGEARLNSTAVPVERALLVGVEFASRPQPIPRSAVLARQAARLANPAAEDLKNRSLSPGLLKIPSRATSKVSLHFSRRRFGASPCHIFAAPAARFRFHIRRVPRACNQCGGGDCGRDISEKAQAGSSHFGGAGQGPGDFGCSGIGRSICNSLRSQSEPYSAQKSRGCLTGAGG